MGQLHRRHAVQALHGHFTASDQAELPGQGPQRWELRQRAQVAQEGVQLSPQLRSLEDGLREDLAVSNVGGPVPKNSHVANNLPGHLL
eukprot:9827-Prorocentrum_lima.AAC.1